MKASELKIGDKIEVSFTNSVCKVVNIDYSYRRASIMLSYCENGIHQNTLIAGHKEVTKYKD